MANNRNKNSTQEKAAGTGSGKADAPATKGSKPSRDMLAGVAVGVGSAAIVAALLYTTRFNRKK